MGAQTAAVLVATAVPASTPAPVTAAATTAGVPLPNAASALPTAAANATAAASAAAASIPTAAATMEAAAVAAAQEPLPKWNIEPLDPGSPFPMKAGAMAHLRAMAANNTPTQDTATAAARGFVVRNGTQFYRNGEPFYFVGGNAYWLIDFYTLTWGREQIEEFLDHVQNLGLPVLRTWMFNDAMPKAFAAYDSRQLAGLHYIIWAAKKRNIMLNFCLGNLWPAYKGPEEFVKYATGSAESKDILDFYADPATRSLFKLHVWGLLSTVNPLTGLAPKDDPTIFAWNILNEPRCPGCMEASQQATHQEFLADMARFIRAADPLHLISAATEGFFVEDRATFLHFYNPGPGAQCDGEDWFKISTIPELDYTTIHVYERHMELLPRVSGNPGWPNWVYCDWECYINWFKNYVEMHEFLAAEVLHKPLVIEEFGLTWWKKTPAQQRVLFKVALDMLTKSADENGALAGAMFWNAADSRVVDSDGYNVKIDKPQYVQPESALSDPVSFPPGMVNDTLAQLLTPDNRTRPVRPDVIFSPVNAPPELRAQMRVPPPVVQPPRPVQPAAAAAAAANAAAVAAAAANGSQANSSTVYVATVAPPAVTTEAAAAVQLPAAAVQPPAAAGAVQIPAAAAAAGAAAAQQTPPPAAAAAAAAVQPPPAAAAVQPLSPVRITVQASDQAPPLQPSLIATGRKLFRLLSDDNTDASATATGFVSNHVYNGVINRGPSRQLLVQDHLDGFRRGGWRAACAEEAAKTWRPYKLFNLTDTITNQPENIRLLQTGDVVEIISAATAKLNRQPSTPAVEQAGKK